MERFANDVPYVIRSHRNRGRRERPQPLGQLFPDSPGRKTEAGSVRCCSDDDPENGAVHNYEIQSRLRLVAPQEHLGYFSTGAIIFNKIVGTGVIVVPATVLAIVGSKGLSLTLWLIGGLTAWAGAMVYLEFGIKFPLTGGELHYVDFVWQKPRLMATYMYAIMYIFLSGTHANAIIFGQSVLQASGPGKGDSRLVKLFSIMLVVVVAQLQAYSRVNYIRFSNMFAAYKIIFLSVLTILGFCALRGQRFSPRNTRANDNYGLVNLNDSFHGSTTSLYNIALALLDIFRVYNGFENANYVLEEVRRPPGDENKVYRLAAKMTMTLVCFFYLMINVSLFAACSTEELLSAPDVLSLFFTKVFGPSRRARSVSAILLCISSAGNVMSVTYATVRVKQEIARMGVIPCPGFWAKDTRLDTPGPALFLHTIFTAALIIACPLDSVNGYLVISTLFNYARTFIAIYMGVVLLLAPRLKSFRNPMTNEPWTPQGSRSKWGKALIYPLAVIYVFSNIFVLVVPWFPVNLHKIFNGHQAVSSYAGPVTVIASFAAGFVYWIWDVHFLPWFGYKTESLQEHRDGLDMHILFQRRLTGRAAKLWGKMSPSIKAARRWKKEYGKAMKADVRDNGSDTDGRSR